METIFVKGVIVDYHGIQTQKVGLVPATVAKTITEETKMEKKETKQKKCSICKNNIDMQVFPNGSTWAEGHNAEPVNKGRCCTKCNETVVVPRRIQNCMEAQ